MWGDIMPNLLLDLEVYRVDLVEEGSNSEAFIKLYKRKESCDNMTLNEILEKIKPEHAAIFNEAIAKAKEEAVVNVTEELKKSKADLEVAISEVAKTKAEFEALTVEVTKTKEDLTKATTDLEAIAKAKLETEKNLSEEEIIKSLDPVVQEVFKSMKAQKLAAEEVVKNLQEKQLNDEAIAKSKEIKCLPVDEAKLVEIAKSASTDVFDILKAASKALETAGIFKSVGTGKEASGSTGAWEKIEKKAAEIAELEKITIQKAITNVIKSEPALYKEYLAGGID